MSQGICSQCGGDIEGAGIKHRARVFCSDECCETFEEAFLTKGAPALDDLGDEELELDDEEIDLEDDEFEDEDLEDDDLESDDDDDR